MVNYNQIIKQDMISIIIDIAIQQDVLNILWDWKNREKDFGIIKSKEEKKTINSLMYRFKQSR